MIYKRKFKLQIYPATINVIIADSIPEAVESNKRIKDYLGEDYSYGSGMCLIEKSSFQIFILLTNKELTSYIITHETLHAVEFITDKIGIYMNSDTIEAFTYLNGYINEKVFQIVEDYKKLENES